MAVLFKINADVNPCKLIKLIKGTETRLIESTESFTPDEFHMESQFLNCFRCDPSMAILCTWYKVFFVSDLMHCLNEVNLEQVDKSISMITAMRKAYKTDEEQAFIFACNIEIDSRQTDLHQYALKYDGRMTENEWTYIFKADIDSDLMSVTLQDRSTTAVLLKNEIAWSVYEYASNCMLISLNNTSDLLLV